ncbi:hypothetical protein EXE41_01210 [Halorubrum sp. SD690R]|uniref:hypothetical protein n=1 Tax=Halorubrum sp. SD690R TaxID=2518117 RepID=UPI0010F4FF28|nr:hypothetical protein [Halorubrum sp. SD690R]TKX48525.1 hypothetical protein EXE41_01210 [Halorubrum sp. SD690R]
MSSETISGAHQELIEQGKRAIHAAVDDCLDSTPDDTLHVVPISSGWDSRFVLGALTADDRVPMENITALSYGVPGSWDFDLGKEIAAHVGVEHVSINLNEIDWSLNSIEDYVSRCDVPMRFFEGYPVAKSLEPFADREHTVWSGFFGLAAGPQLSKPIAATWSDGQDWFIRRNKTTDLAPNGYSPRAALPEKPLLDPSELEYEYQIDMSTRQPSFIGPVVSPPGHKCQFPLLNRHWLKFILNVPTKFRLNARLYHDILVDSYPKLFALPGDSAHGQPLTSSVVRKGVARIYQAIRHRAVNKIGQNTAHPKNKFVNFEKKIRKDTDLHETIRKLLTDLCDRDRIDWIDILDIWERHQQGQDNSMELRILASIELTLRTGTSQDKYDL